MKIIEYPHPTLRHKSKPLRRVDAALRDLIAEMFELMRAAQGVGLAANQVDLPYRVFVANLGGERGEDKDLVFINPVISAPKGSEEAEEGCLSIPELYAPVRRPATVNVSAYNLAGEEIQATLDGLLARVVQHEIDHLDGILFIDRLSPSAEMEIKEEVAEFEDRFFNRREEGKEPSDAQVAERLAELESKYC